MFTIIGRCVRGPDDSGQQLVVTASGKSKQNVTAETMLVDLMRNKTEGLGSAEALGKDYLVFSEANMECPFGSEIIGNAAECSRASSEILGLQFRTGTQRCISRAATVRTPPACLWRESESGENKFMWFSSDDKNLCQGIEGLLCRRTSNGSAGGTSRQATIQIMTPPKRATKLTWTKEHRLLPR